MGHHVKDESLADAGKARMDWANRDMPVLSLIKERFEKEKPLEGVKMSACLHVTAETANLMKTLKCTQVMIMGVFLFPPSSMRRRRIDLWCVTLKKNS